MQKAFFIPCLVLLGLGCRPERAAVPEEAHREIVLLPGSSFEFANLCAANDGISLYDRSGRAVYFFDASGKNTKLVALQAPDTMGSGTGKWSVYPVSPDSIVVVRQGSKALLLFDGDGRFVKTIPATAKLADGSSDYVLIGAPQCPVIAGGDALYAVCSRMDVVVRTPDARKSYFSTPPDICFGAGGQTNTGVWPDEYRSGDNFRDYYPQRCVNGKGQLVYGFAASDSLYVTENGKFVSAHVCKSEHMTKRHAFPDDSTGHFEYLDRYLVAEPRYLGLSYDAHRKLYYRVAHHALAYERKGGMTVNDFLDKPWSLMILDEEFNVLSETKFDPARFLPIVLPVKEGLLLVQRRPKNNVLPVKLSLYTIRE